MNAAENEEGMTLVEILITVFVSSLLLGLLAMLFINASTAQGQATARDRVTGQANVISASITSSIRNATSVKVASSGLRVDAVVAVPGGSWQCRSWALDAGKLLYSSGSTARPTSTAGWTALAPTAEATLTGAKPFALQGTNTVKIGLRMTDASQTATISDGVAAQAVAAGGPACW